MLNWIRKVLNHRYDRTLEATVKPGDGDWLYVAIVETRWRRRYYINGKKVSKQKYHKAIGCDSWVDEQVTWKGKRSRKQIEKSMTEKVSGNEADLIAWFSFHGDDDKNMPEL